MKIITLSANTSWYLYNFRKSTIKKFIQEGYKVICISPRDEYTSNLENLGCDWVNLKMNNKGANPLSDIKIIFRLLSLYIRYKPVASFHFTLKNNIYGTWAAFISRTPAVNNISGLGTAFIRPGLTSSIVRVLYKLSQPMAKRIYCQNKDDFKLLIKTNLVSKNKLYLLPGSGVDIQRFKPSLSLNNGSRLFRFLYVGRLLADKGIFELIEAIKNINKHKVVCSLWICGFTNKDNISAISDKDISNWQNIPGIKWIKPTHKIESVMKDVDCIVLPSYREGMPRSLLEAGAMGLPSVATNVPGCRSIIQNKINGLLCEAENSNSLELAMLKMLEMPKNDIHQMSIAARNIVVKSFDEKIVIDAAMDALNSVQNY
jgi:glycosyltransferase involved in cell wall biosynthesis